MLRYLISLDFGKPWHLFTPSTAIQNTLPLALHRFPQNWRINFCANLLSASKIPFLATRWVLLLGLWTYSEILDLAALYCCLFFAFWLWLYFNQIISTVYFVLKPRMLDSLMCTGLKSIRNLSTLPFQALIMSAWLEERLEKFSRLNMFFYDCISNSAKNCLLQTSIALIVHIWKDAYKAPEMGA